MPRLHLDIRRKLAYKCFIPLGVVVAADARRRPREREQRIRLSANKRSSYLLPNKLNFYSLDWYSIEFETFCIVVIILSDDDQRAIGAKKLVVLLFPRR